MSNEAYAYGFLTKLAEYGIDAQDFFDYASRSGDRSIVKVASAVSTAVMEKRAFSDTSTDVAWASSMMPLIGGVVSGLSEDGNFGTGLGTTIAGTGGSILGSSLGSAIGRGNRRGVPALIGGALGAGLGGGMAHEHLRDKSWLERIGLG